MPILDLTTSPIISKLEILGFQRRADQSFVKRGNREPHTVENVQPRIFETTSFEDLALSIIVFLGNNNIKCFRCVFNRLFSTRCSQSIKTTANHDEVMHTRRPHSNNSVITRSRQRHEIW